jgi:tripartite-type tricarboxylate transporter receptor subunit TctC
MITPVSSTISSAPYLFKSLPFDPAKDFAAVTTIASLSFAIAVDAAGPVKSVRELVDSLKAKPNHGFYGTGNNTGVIAAELFKAKAGLQTTYVPYKANAPALVDLLQGQLDFLSWDATWMMSQHNGGKIRILPRLRRSAPSRYPRSRRSPSSATVATT